MRRAAQDRQGNGPARAPVVSGEQLEAEGARLGPVGGHGGGGDIQIGGAGLAFAGPCAVGQGVVGDEDERRPATQQRPGRRDAAARAQGHRLQG